MDAREQTRLRLTADVMRLLRSRDFRTILAPPQTVAQVFVGLPDDTILAASQRISDLGGSAHVFILSTTDSLSESVLVRMDITAGPCPPPAMSEDDCPVRPNTHLAMLVELLKLRHTVTFHMHSQETVVRLIDDGRKPVPAGQ